MDDLAIDDLKAINKAVSVRRAHVQPVEQNGFRKPSKKKYHLSCITGKRCYRDPREADRALRNMANVRKNEKENGIASKQLAYRKYHCVSCNYWHTSSKRDITTPEYLNVA